MSNSAGSLPDYRAEAIEDGYIFECTCGELYKSDVRAVACRKCRTYLMEEDYDTRTVRDARNGNLIWAAWAYREREAAKREAELLARAAEPVAALTYKLRGLRTSVR